MSGPLFLRSLTIGLLLSFVVFTCSPQVVADEPGKVTATQTFLSFNGKTFGFLGQCVLEVDGKPAAAFGLRQAPGGKSKYTYLLLFKPDPKGNGENSTESESKKSSIGSDGSIDVILKLGATVQGRPINVDYQLEADGEKIASEMLKVEGKEYGKNGPRVFLVDLADKKAAIIPIQVTPEAVPEFADEKAWGKQILAAVKELQEKSKEAKEFFAKEKK
ncbi:MAG: hypothetical protein K8R36_21040 [Planctomycetales bacterium]|nr:hypothetical protein [Planctomycetales bacterium]